jgi:hypothetical protein
LGLPNSVHAVSVPVATATSHIEIANPDSEATPKRNPKEKDTVELSIKEKIEHEHHADDKKDKQQQMADEEKPLIHNKLTAGVHAKKNEEEMVEHPVVHDKTRKQHGEGSAKIAGKNVVTHDKKDGGSVVGSSSHGKKETSIKTNVVAPIATAETQGKKGGIVFSLRSI